MKIDIKYTGVDSTPAIEEYINEKIGALAKFIQGLEKGTELKAFVEIGRTTKHHQKGPVFRAECNVEVPGTILRVEHEDWDIRVAIDKIKNVMQGRIKKYLETHRP